MSRLRINRAGFVYFVQEEDLKRIKIGFTASHLSKRLKTLANASSQKLVFLGFQLGDESLEKNSTVSSNLCTAATSGSMQGQICWPT